MINLSMPEIEVDLRPHITVFGVGGAGGNAVNNMIKSNLEGVEFVVANTDAQALKGAWRKSVSSSARRSPARPGRRFPSGCRPRRRGGAACRDHGLP